MKALHKQQGKWYAVKMIPVHSLQPNLPDDSDSDCDVVPQIRTTHSNIVLREVEVLESCQHPNICQLKETFLESGRLSTFRSQSRCSMRLANMSRHRPGP